MATEHNEQTGTGVPALDEQHLSLMEHLGQLLSALSREPTQNRLGTLFAVLTMSAVHHFVDEDRCMVASGCHVAEANSAAHRQFMARLGSVQVQAEMGGDTADLLVAVSKLRVWLLSHYRTCDCKLRSYVADPAVQQALVQGLPDFDPRGDLSMNGVWRSIAGTV